MSRKQKEKFRPAERPSKEETHKWNKILCEHNLSVDEGRFLRDENGKYIRGGIIVLSGDKARYDKNGELVSDFGQEAAKGYWVGQFEADRLDALVEDFLRMSPGQAEAVYGMNPGTAYRLQREFFEQSDRPDIDLARRVLGYSDTDRDTSLTGLVEILKAYRFLTGKAA